MQQKKVLLCKPVHYLFAFTCIGIVGRFGDIYYQGRHYSCCYQRYRFLVGLLHVIRHNRNQVLYQAIVCNSRLAL